MSRIISNLESNLESIFDKVREDVAKLRTGLVNAELVEDIPVEVYDSEMSIKEIGTIRKVGPSELYIEPWDKNNLKELEKALYQADIGASPVADQSGVRLKFPSLTAERRDSLLRDLNERIEQAKQQIRAARQKARKEAEKLEPTQGKDFVYRMKEDIEDTISKFKDKLQELKDAKEKEIKK
ncbi:MAG: ribosome-recycling factor [Patescibacteria group bacterium]|nr:ribosome-recycling factor [Patescibacteria group bacterium]